MYFSVRRGSRDSRQEEAETATFVSARRKTKQRAAASGAIPSSYEGPVESPGGGPVVRRRPVPFTQDVRPHRLV